MSKGKWGWYPCDLETYRKLKAINKVYLQALHSKACWERWYRKKPHNRVMRAKLKTASGRVVGYQAPQPIPEPAICSIFCKKTTKTIGNWSYDVVELVDWPIIEDYRKAKYPVKAEEACSPLSMKKDDIDKIYDLIK